MVVALGPQRAPRLLAITPPEGPCDPTLVEIWLEAGVPADQLAVLLRDPYRALPSADSSRWAALRGACAHHGVQVLLSCDGQDLAEREAMLRGLQTGIAGYQLRADPPAEALRRIRESLGTVPILGRSCHGAPAVGDRWVDYTCVAPVFSPRTLQRGRPKAAIGLSRLREWSTEAPPNRHILALGGICQANARACIEAGARGLASIHAFFSAPTQVAVEVRALWAAVGPRSD